MFITLTPTVLYHLHFIMLRQVLQDLARGDLAVEFRETDFTT